MEHSRFGGSSASRYLNCPGSVVLSEQAPERLTSSYAEEGTFAHALAERALLASAPVADTWLGTKIAHPLIDSVKVVDQAMIDAVNVYLEAVWDVYTYSSDICVEEKFTLDIPAAQPGEVFGSNDAAVFNRDTGRLTVFDYKHGQGIGVSAYENKQLMFYATGAVASHPEWDVRSIELVIVQPRGPFPYPMSRWEMPLWKLLDYPAEINNAVKEALRPLPPFNPGKHCRWCPASEICTAREKQFMEAAKLDFASVVEITPVARFPVADAIDVDRIGKILVAFDNLSAWVDNIRARAESIMLAGGHIPGMKVVDKVARRKWAADDTEIASYLEMMFDLERNDIMPRKLVTITEAEKQLKAKLGKEFNAEVKNDLTVRFMTKDSTGYACVFEQDKRPAVAPVQAEFGSVVDINSLFDGE